MEKCHWGEKILLVSNAVDFLKNCIESPLSMSDSILWHWRLIHDKVCWGVERDTAENGREKERIMEETEV